MVIGDRCITTVQSTIRNCSLDTKRLLGAESEGGDGPWLKKDLAQKGMLWVSWLTGSSKVETE